MKEQLQDMSLFVVYVVSTLLMMVFAGVLILVFVVQKRKQNRYHREKMEREFDFQKKLLQTKIEVQEQSMKIIAREIHDHSVQCLGLVVSGLKGLLRTNPDLSQSLHMTHSLELVEQTINDLRNLSHSLHNEQIIKYGLSEMIRKELYLLSEQYPIAFNQDIDEEAVLMSSDKQVLFYRIFQESVQNALKHADCKQIGVKLKYEASVCSLEVKDDGRGFALTTMEKEGGIGLNNMKERTKLLNGQLNIFSSPGKGCCITLSVKTSNND